MLTSKASPSPDMRRQSIRSQFNTPKTNPALSCLSPSFSTVSSYSNLRRPSRPRRTSISSTTSGNSTSSLTSVSTTSSTIKKRFFSSSSNNGYTLEKTSSQRYTRTITVTIRIKPIAELIPQWTAINSNQISHPDHGDFTFDHVFGPQCDNHTIFNQIGSELVDKLFDGFNSTLFAYGMTGSGKTYTMLGEGYTEKGIVELCGSYLFNRTENDPNHRFNITVSYLEIYNEKIHDLLDPTKNNENLKLRGDHTIYGNGIHVAGLTERNCQDCNELMKWVKMGELSRKTGKTDYNTRSSRSHAIIQFKLISTDTYTSTIRSNILSLCDLAGSERPSGQIERRKEGAYINKSLLALGTVISKLSAESNIKDNVSSGSSTNNGLSHIPYRDSKLTRLLQPALSGNSIITTICTIDPKKDAYAETINTLRFSSRAKNVSLSISKRSINAGLAYNDNMNNNTSDLEKDRKIRELTNLVKEHENTIQELKQNIMIPQFTDRDLIISYENPNSNSKFVETNLSNENLVFENKLLKDKIQYLEKLLDKDVLELQDTQIVEIVEMLPIEVGGLLETKVQGLESEIRQYKLYTKQLEDKLFQLQRKNQEHKCKENLNTESVSPTSSLDYNNQYKEFEDLIQLKENKINDLQKMLERKDMMIEALQSSKRIRDRTFNSMANDHGNPTA